MRVIVAWVCVMVFLWGQDAPAVGRTLTLDLVAQGSRWAPRGLPGLQWLPDGEHFSHLERRGDDVVLRVRSATDPSFDRVAATWSAVGKSLEAAGWEGVGPGVLASAEVGAAGEIVLRVGAGRVAVSAEGSVRVLVPDIDGVSVSVPSKDLGAVAYVKDYDIYVWRQATGHQRITFDGCDDLTHGVSVSRVEFGIQDGLWWNDQGSRFAFYEEDFRPIKAYPFVDMGKRPARLEHARYPMAGQAGSTVRVGVHDVASGATVWLKTDPKVDQYLTNVTWNPSGNTIIVAHVNRAQDRTEVWEYDAATGERAHLLFVESDREWTEPESGPRFLPDGSGDFLWASPRNGFRHLWRYRGDGRLVGPVTQGAFDLMTLVGFSPDGHSVFWESTGSNPLEQHLFESSFDGKSQRQITRGRGRHSVQVSPSGRFALDTFSHLELPLATELVAVETGEVLSRLHEAPDPFQGFQRCREELFTVTTEDGATLHGYLVLPPTTKPGEKHPVIQYVYGGPHSQLVVDAWMSGGSRWNLWLHALAQRGYVCFMVDGRGTAQRGIAWQQAVFRRLGTLEADDQVAALKEILKRPDVDGQRVGVTGWSYGGFMTLTLMTRKADHYRVGVAGAPVTDWAYYETGYGERYMDTPEENPEGYRDADPGSHVEKMRGKLLVAHGTRDDTVVPQNLMDFLQDAIRAGKVVHTLIYPGQLHGLRGPAFEHFLDGATHWFDTHLRTP